MGSKQSVSVVSGTANLQGLALKDLPISDLQLHRDHLRILQLSRNDLTSVPEAIADLHELCQVDLCSNRFAHFPIHVLQLPRLERLDLSTNAIAKLPPEMASASMMSLLVGKNQLTTLPPTWIGETEEDSNEFKQRLPSLLAVFIQENHIDISTISPSCRTLFHGVEYQSFPQEIERGLFLGSKFAAQDVARLLSHGIQRVVMVSNSNKRKEGQSLGPFPDDIQYLELFCDDTPQANLSSLFNSVADFIGPMRILSDSPCLVHCTQGVSRSAALVTAYLMQEKAMSFTNARDFVRRKRFCIEINQGFQEQLRDYETLLSSDCPEATEGELGK